MTFFCIKRMSFALAALTLLACGGKPSQPPAIKVAAVKLHYQTIPLEKEYIGITKSISEIGIRARVKGFLDEMNFTEGTLVKKGQLLFVIDPRPFKAKLDMALGDLTRAVAEETFQQIEYKRMQVLVKKDDVSKAQYDKTLTLLESAKGAVQSAKANVEQAKINLDYCYMYAPSDGLIGKKYVDVGNLVGAGEETLLATVVMLNPIYVEFSPSTSDYALMLKHRDEMPFKVRAFVPLDSKIAFDGEMNLINNQADTSSSTVYMRATVQNPEQTLLPGIYLNVKVTLSQHEKALLIPLTAVIDNQGLQSVFVVNKNNQLETRGIKTNGQFENQFMVESGLSEGDIVVTEGVQKLKPNMQVLPGFTTDVTEKKA